MQKILATAAMALLLTAGCAAQRSIDVAMFDASAETVPVGATALCRDGRYSFALVRSAVCSRHGGVEKWLQLI